MRKAALASAIVVAVLLVAGWFADGVLRRAAEESAASALQSSLGLPQKPDVAIDGFPFALSLLTRSVPGAHASAGRVPLTVSGHDLQLTGVRVRTGEISLLGNTAQVTRADATGVLDYGGLAALAGLPVSYAGEGRLKVVYTTQLAGQQVSFGVTAVPVLDAERATIRLTGPKLDPGNPPPVPVPAAELSRLARPIPVRLPGGARLTALTPSEGGVAIAASVTGLSFPVR